MSQWIDRPGPDDDPVVRVEDELGGQDQGGDAERRPGGVADVHADTTRDLGLYSEGEGTPDVDDDVAEGLAGDEPAKRHGDPLVPREGDASE